MMKIIVNDENFEVEESITIEGIFLLLKISDFSGYAIARNEEVIPKSYWKKTNFKDGDNIIIIQATQGG